MARKRHPPKRPTRSTETNQVTLRALSGDVCHVAFGKDLQELAMRWSYIVGNRSRWTERKESRDDVAHRAAHDLAKLGITAKHLQQLAVDLIVEVCIPFRREDVGWEARILPWEFMLSAATRKYRGPERLMVVRQLKRTGHASSRQPRSLAVIKAAPGPIREMFDFDGEANLVRGSLEPPLTDRSLEQYLESTGRPVDILTPRLLKEALAELNPDVIHLTAVDTHLGAELLKQSRRGPINDGMLLSGERNLVEPVEALPLADLLTAGRTNPLFVGFNLWNSANRIAPLTIAAGAQTAIAFQTSIDEAIAELFFVNFYRNWREAKWNAMQAFLQSFDALRHHGDRLRGTGIVLWSAVPLIESIVSDAKKRRIRSSDVKSILGESSRRAAERKLALREADADDLVRDAVEVTVETEPQLNYSLLHNRRSILKTFTIRFLGADKVRRRPASEHGEFPRQPVGTIRDIEVEVILHVGAESFPYRTNVGLNEEQPFLSLVSDSRGDPSFFKGEGIHVPLTSHLARSVDERMQTSLYVDVQWRGQVLYRHTHSVSLQPVDEWMLDDRDISWVPSFVQPRDPAVARIVQSAQKYLKCISDYLPAGFDGYQSFDPDGETTHEQWLGVDYQVQALWHALVLDHPLQYINPPPSYREAAQRLRTPGQILSQGRGTCVDLAILMASCLEWIEVYPVLFLLDEHAFPGYWRSESAYNDFLSVSEARAIDAAKGGTPKFNVNEPWISDRSTYLEIKRYIDEELLVPLETVSLTTPTGFFEAIAEVKEQYFSRLRSASFYSMVNIMRAREAGVTPLPLCNSM